MDRAPVLLISHGAATLTIRRGNPVDRALREAGILLEDARAVLVVSAHDVRPTVTVGRAERVPMWADHPAADGLDWEAPGDPELADAVARGLQRAGIHAVTGQPHLDHGAWVPLRALDPNGRRPVVTVSLRASLEPQEHLALGRALAPWRDDGVAVVASGGLTHNQQAFRAGYFAGTPEDAVDPRGARFEAWVLAALSCTGTERARRLLEATDHPDYAWAHPTPDHWMPALVAAGAADADPGQTFFQGSQHALSTTLVAFGAGTSAHLSR